MAIVYRHIRKDKNEPFYIGIGESENRAYNTKARGIHWKNIVSKTDYEVEILFDNLSYEEAKEKERDFIALYGRSDSGTGILINQTDGGEGTRGRIYSEQWRKEQGVRMSQRVLSEEHKRKIGESHKGIKHTEETKVRMKGRLGNKGGKLSEEVIAKRQATRKANALLKGRIY